MKMNLKELKEFLTIVPPDTIIVIEFVEEEGETDGE